MSIHTAKWQMYASNARKKATEVAHELHAQFEAQGFHGLTDFRLVRFEPIDAAALEAVLNWESHRFPWEDTARSKKKHPKAFDLALWFADRLCGLCFAEPNGTKTLIRIVLLESDPDPLHPLKGAVTTFILIAINQYAKQCQSTAIEIVEPLAEVLPHYLSLGFRFLGGKLVLDVDWT
jgi:hypothetical protein